MVAEKSLLEVCNEEMKETDQRLMNVPFEVNGMNEFRKKSDELILLLMKLKNKKKAIINNINVFSTKINNGREIIIWKSSNKDV
ncbi:hypothetical protein C0J52_04531 [Blattella germanica]|nr:hypothetical protein C0J52_04531 [Blattella germanica]